MTISINTADIITIDSQKVARIGKNPNLYGRGKFTLIYSGPVGTMDQPHHIQAPVYVGGPSEWTINPAFEAEVRKALA